MTILINPQPFSLSGGNPSVISPTAALLALTERVNIRVKRPTTAAPISWPANARLRIRLVITADGVAHVFEGTSSGGIRLDAQGQEIPYYILGCAPTYGFFGATSGPPKRLGEGKTTYTVRLELLRISGSLTSEVDMVSSEAAAPPETLHASVAFDAATSAQESSGDGVLSLTHTSATTNPAVFAATSGTGAGDPGSTSVTYGGTGMTEMWDMPATPEAMRNAGYRLAGQSGGAQAVTSTFADVMSKQALIVISMTGVDQTTPVGTPVTSPDGAVSPASVTVASVGTDDLVVDSITKYEATSLTVGADQTQRDAESFGGGEELRCSTQPGSAGGVMSWTMTGAPDMFWNLGAVAFKASAAAATVMPPPPRIVSFAVTRAARY